MILNEANDLTYEKKFRDAKGTPQILQAIKEFCGSVGFTSYNKAEWDKFVEVNLYALYTECDKYGLSLDNPFFQFLQEYSKQNGNIAPFLVQENYSILHNCISNGILYTKQLSFKCPEVEQVRILVNPNLWSITPKTDILYLIKIYVWVSETDMDAYVLNAYVRAAFSKEVLTPKGKVNFTEPDGNLDITTNKIGLLKCLLFKDFINQLSVDKIKITDTDKASKERLVQIHNDIQNVIRDQHMLVSGKFQSVDLIEQQVGVLREQVQESGRARNGQYQETDTEKGENERGIETFSPRQKQNIYYKSKPIIDAIKSTFNVTSNADIRDIINALGDIYG